MAVEHWLPGFFDENDDAGDAGGEASRSFIVHRGRRRHALTADVLEELGAVRVVLDRELVPCGLTAVVARALQLVLELLPRRIPDRQDLLGGDLRSAVRDGDRRQVLERSEGDDFPQSGHRGLLVSRKDRPRSSEHGRPPRCAELVAVLAKMQVNLDAEVSVLLHSLRRRGPAAKALREVAGDSNDFGKSACYAFNASKLHMSLMLPAEPKCLRLAFYLETLKL